MGVEALDYRKSDVPAEVRARTRGRGADVVVDILGGVGVIANLSCMAPGGRHVSLSFMAGPVASVDFGMVMRGQLTLTASTLRPKSDAEKARIRDAVAAELLPLVADGRAAPVISRRFALTEAAAAHACLESGENFGKIVLLSGAGA
jgi:NADPH:quinone reductase-like Zn-dependent oxidoreductase